MSRRAVGIVRVFDDQTGDPATDNEARALNRRLHRTTVSKFYVRARGRARRAQVKRAEYPRYARMIGSAVQELRDRT